MAVDEVSRTLASYQQGFQAYLDNTPVEQWPVAVALMQRFVAGLAAGARVLEIGSGPGQDADRLEALGVTVQRSDATAAFVVRMREMGHDALLIDVRDGPLGGPWDGVYANAVLLHLGRDELGPALGRLHDAVRPGGRLALTMKAGDGQDWSSHKLGLPRHFVFWQLAQLRSVLEAAGWTVLALEEAAGARDDWLVVLAGR